MNLFLSLFLTFFKIGALTFGGGYAMLPMIEQEVMAHRWMELEELIDFIAVSESTPGPFAVNVSTYIGSRMGGFFGAVCATMGVVMPSFLIILIVVRAYQSCRENRFVEGALSGLRPGVVGLIAAALVSVGTTVFFPDGIRSDVVLTSRFWMSAVLFAGSVWIRKKRKIHPAVLILMAAVVGIICGEIGIL